MANRPKTYTTYGGVCTDIGGTYVSGLLPLSKATSLSAHRVLEFGLGAASQGGALRVCLLILRVSGDTTQYEQSVLPSSGPFPAACLVSGHQRKSYARKLYRKMQYHRQAVSTDSCADLVIMSVH